MDRAPEIFMSCIEWIFPFTSALLVLYAGAFAWNQGVNVDKILNFIFNTPGVGIIKSNKNKLSVKTDKGIINIPSIKLPNFETSVFFFKKDIDFEDGMVDIELVELVDKDSIIHCKQYRNILITEIFKASDIEKKELRGCIKTEFEEKCFIFTLKNNEIVDYSLLFKRYENELENYCGFENISDKN